MKLRQIALWPERAQTKEERKTTTHQHHHQQQQQQQAAILQLYSQTFLQTFSFLYIVFSLDFVIV